MTDHLEEAGFGEGHVTEKGDPVHPPIQLITYVPNTVPPVEVIYDPDPWSGTDRWIQARQEDIVELPFDDS